MNSGRPVLHHHAYEGTPGQKDPSAELTEDAHRPLGSPQPPRVRRQKGAVLLTIMMVLLVSMALATGLINHYAVAEARAVEQTLAQLRADWAMMGHINYVVGRLQTAQAGSCDTGSSCSATSINAAISSYFAELENTSDGLWHYDRYEFFITSDFPTATPNTNLTETFSLSATVQDELGDPHYFQIPTAGGKTDVMEGVQPASLMLNWCYVPSSLAESDTNFDCTNASIINTNIPRIVVDAIRRP